MGIQTMALMEIRSNCDKARELVFSLGRKFPELQAEIGTRDTEVGELLTLISKNRDWAHELLNMPTK